MKVDLRLGDCYRNRGGWKHRAKSREGVRYEITTQEAWNAEEGVTRSLRGLLP